MSVDWSADHLATHRGQRKSMKNNDTQKLVTVGLVLVAAALVAYYLEKRGVPHVGAHTGAGAGPPLPKPPTAGGYRPPVAPAAPRPQVPAHASSGASGSYGDDDGDDGDDDAPAAGNQYTASYGDGGGAAYSAN